MNYNSSSGMAVQLIPPNLPVGWRFHPSDHELLDHYLKRKRLGAPIHGLDITEVELCNYYPWDLPDLSMNKSGDKVWYFFSRREYHKNSGLAKRKARTGHWKCTGDIRSVTLEEGDKEIGTKRTLVFHNPDATHWVIHEYEYTAQLNLPIKGNFVLCKLKIKVNKKKKAVKSKNADPDCNKVRPYKKAREGESDCDVASASAFKNQNSKEVMANPPYGEGEPSNHMISDLKIHNQYPNNMATNEKGNSSYHKNSANQNEYEMTYISTANHGEISHLMVSNFENENVCQISVVSTYNKGETRFLVGSDLENLNPNKMTTAMALSKNIKPSCLLASGLENQNVDKISIVSVNNDGEPSCLLRFGFEYQKPGEMTAMSFYDKDKPNNLVTLDFENQNPGKNVDISASVEGEWSSIWETPFDFGCQNHYEKNDVSFLENYFSPSIASNVVENTSQEVESQYEKADMLIPEHYQGPLMASNIQGAICQEIQSQYKNINKPIPEDNCSPLMMPSNVQEAPFQEFQSQHNKADMPMPELVEEMQAFFELESSLNSTPLILEDNQGPVMASDIGEATFPELNPELVEELKAFFELEGSLNSTPPIREDNQGPVMALGRGEATSPELNPELVQELKAFCELEGSLNTLPQ